MKHYGDDLIVIENSHVFLGHNALREYGGGRDTEIAPQMLRAASALSQAFRDGVEHGKAQVQDVAVSNDNPSSAVERLAAQNAREQVRKGGLGA